MLKTFIERPVLSTVISIIVVILGILGIVVLPVTQYPEIAPPTVQVRPDDDDHSMPINAAYKIVVVLLT